MKILTVDISQKQKSEILEDFQLLNSGYICVTSVHGLIEAYENKDINEAFTNSFANIPDGMPIVYYGKWIKRVNLDRITGPDFIYDFLEMLNDTFSSIVTIGSDKNTISKFKNILNQNYKNIEILNSDYSFVDVDSSKSMNRIKEFCMTNNANYYLVFLSTPKQDLLMNFLNKKLNLKMVGFGAAVDYVVGNTKSAPKIVQKLSLEWFFRLMQEPKRLFKRYLNIVPKFFYYLLISSLFKKKQ